MPGQLCQVPTSSLCHVSLVVEAVEGNKAAVVDSSLDCMVVEVWIPVVDSKAAESAVVGKVVERGDADNCLRGGAA